MELLTCPFCGGVGKWIGLWAYVDHSGKTHIPRVDGSETHGKVRCESCGASTGTGMREIAEKAWNRRVM
jgi:transcription elongation factor Elf1